MLQLKTLTEVDLTQKRVLVREDLNVPIKNGVVQNDARIQAILPTIQYLLKQQARILIISHLGRPKVGQFDPQASLKPIAEALSQLLQQPVKFYSDWLNGVDLAPGEIGLGENVRFLAGEETDDPVLGRKMANLCDVFVMDAFATSHRAQASTHQAALQANHACAGLLLMQEVQALSQVLYRPARPLVAIVGGAKISTKLDILANLLKVTDQFIVGGGMANTFLAAQGVEVGQSLVERSLIPTAKTLLQQYQAKILLPQDVRVSKSVDGQWPVAIKNLNEIAREDIIVDVGPRTEQVFHECLQAAQTILWNGPVGIFEIDAFAKGTEALADSITQSAAFTVAGGGDTLAAVAKFHLAPEIDYISTAGGAFLEFIEGKMLPGLVPLIK